MKIDISRFRELEEQKYLSCQKHPSADLLIWNYTQLAQFAKVWCPETLMARGLITDFLGNVKARPFKKFFNYEEHFGEDCKLPPLPLEPFTVTEKMDGSLGILYWVDDIPYIATRGSFTSEQAIKGTEILHRDYSHVEFDSYCTYLFEIIYPANRIVIDYNGMEDIVLLAVVETETGREVKNSLYSGFIPVVKTYEFDDIAKIKEVQEDNKEGFVIRFESGVRTKIKMAEYVRLHRLVTGVNAKTIWELLKNGHDFTDLLERVPDEFYDWVKNTKAELEKQFHLIEQESKSRWIEALDMDTRKKQAQHISKTSQYPGVVFAMLDSKPYKDIIWKLIKPRADKPWKEDKQ